MAKKDKTNDSKDPKDPKKQIDVRSGKLGTHLKDVHLTKTYDQEISNTLSGDDLDTKIEKLQLISNQLKADLCLIDSTSRIFSEMRHKINKELIDFRLTKAGKSPATDSL